jgi:hypothetical protein
LQTARFTLSLKQGEGRVRAVFVASQSSYSFAKIMPVVKYLAVPLPSASVPENHFSCSKMLQLMVVDKLRSYNPLPSAPKCRFGGYNLWRINTKAIQEQSWLLK